MERVGQHLLLLPTVLLGLALFSLSISTLLLDLTVPLAAALTYFAVGQLFRKLESDFIAGAEAFAFTPKEFHGRDMEVAALPESHTRDAVIRLLRTHLGVKLWEPAPRGLGQPWLEQGWVLWRWSQLPVSSEPAAAPCASTLTLHWVRVGVDSVSLGRSALAQAIAEAMRNKALEQ